MKRKIRIFQQVIYFIIMSLLFFCLLQCVALSPRHFRGDDNKDGDKPKDDDSDKPDKDDEGEEVRVTGKIIIEKNTYYIEENKSLVRYKLVGLEKDEKEKLDSLEGKNVILDLRVVSINSAKAMNAQLIKIVSY
jgi:hypothetical protein